MMSKSRYPSWTVLEIYNAITNGDSSKVYVPIYQRGTCWGKEKEIKLIDSLRRGFPIGTLLFYNYPAPNDDKYTLVDGLQRCNTIKRYIERPMDFITAVDLDNDIVKELTESFKLIEEDVIAYLLDCIKDINDFSNIQYSDFADAFIDRAEMLDVDSKTVRKILEPLLVSLATNYKEICAKDIPIVIYSGSVEELNMVFTRINEKPVPLTDYEIYAASWPSEPKIAVKNSLLLDEVLAKYDAIHDAGFTLEKYDREKIRSSSSVTYYEFVYGISRLISKQYEILDFCGEDSQANSKETKINNIGFGLVNVCLGGKSKKDIAYLYEKIARIDVNAFECALVESIEYVNACIAPLIRFKSNARGKRKPFHSQYQIMSMISCVYKMMYDENICKKESWDQKKDKLTKTLVQHYIYDIVMNKWTTGGTKTLYNQTNEDGLSIPISYDSFENALDYYYRDSCERKESRNVKPVEAEEIILLNCIYLNEFNALDQLDSGYYDVEHIATKKQMGDLIKKTDSVGLPLSCFSNLCFLPEYVNRTKKEKTFYQDEKYREVVALETVEKKYSFTKEEDLNWLNEEYTKDNSERLKENYLHFLDERYEIQKEKIMTMLCTFAGVEKTEKAIVDISCKPSLPDKNLKVGEFILTAMTCLSESSFRLSEDIIEKLCDKVWCSKNMGTYMPYLAKEGSDFNKKRYYKRTLLFSGKRYYLNAQLTEKAKHREKFIVWYDSL